MTIQTKGTKVSNQKSVLDTVDRAGARLQTVEQVPVSSRSSGLDGRDNLCREGWVTVAQLGQLHRKRSQPTTQHFTPSETTGEEKQKQLVCNRISSYDLNVLIFYNYAFASLQLDSLEIISHHAPFGKFQQQKTKLLAVATILCADISLKQRENTLEKVIFWRV